MAEEGKNTAWWAFVLVGLIWIIFGGLFVLLPEIVLGILVVVVGAFLFIEGLSRIIRGVFGSKGSPHSIFLLLSGILIGAIGIAAFIGPAVFAAALVYLVALWAFIVGLGELGAAITLRGVPANRWLQGIKGGMSILFGVLLVLNPLIAAVLLIQVLGIFAVLHGALDIVLGFVVRGESEAAGKKAVQTSG